MKTRACTMCRSAVPNVDHPVLCTSCGHLQFPREGASERSTDPARLQGSSAVIPSSPVANGSQAQPPPATSAPRVEVVESRDSERRRSSTGAEVSGFADRDPSSPRRPATQLFTRVTLLRRDVILDGGGWALFVILGAVLIASRWSSTSGPGNAIALLGHCLVTGILAWLAAVRMNRLGQFPEFVDWCLLGLVLAAPWVALAPLLMMDVAPASSAACSLVVLGISLVPSLAVFRRFPSLRLAPCLCGPMGALGVILTAHVVAPWVAAAVAAVSTVVGLRVLRDTRAGG